MSLADPHPARQVVVLIPAHNEAASIKETITSLCRQTRPPDEIIVVSDNSMDATDDRSMLHGAKVLVTVRNEARKAGALNQAMREVLPTLTDDDLVLVMDADSQLASAWIECAVDTLDHERAVGGVSGSYTGEPGPGLLRQLQRNEFVRASRLVRRRADLWVLSGTGTLFRVPVLREVARERGRRLPGTPGEYYDSTSITEDYEITLALKTLGYRCLCPPGCTAVTELMPTWQHLFRQRLRWQSGTLTALRRYGFTQATWTNWVRQAFFYLRYCSQIACWVVLLYSLAAHFGFNMPGWVLGMLLAIYLERVITARGAGRKGVLVAALLLPEWWYGMFDGLAPGRQQMAAQHTTPPLKPVRPGLHLGVFEPGETESYRPVSRFAAAVGREPDIVLYYSGWGEPFLTQFARTTYAKGAEPLVQMYPGHLTLAQIAHGQHDGYLRRYAAQVRAFGHPVILSFAPESNGPWYSWGWTHTPAATWVAAWRHVVRVFRAAGAGNVTWLLTLNVAFPDSGPVRAYWPGAAYVDWVGIDGYYVHPGATFKRVFLPTVRAVRKLTSKPVLISEAAVGPIAGQVRGIGNLFAAIRRYGLTGLVWFDQAQHHGIFHQDWRLADDAAALAKFRQEAGDFGRPLKAS